MGHWTDSWRSLDFRLHAKASCLSPAAREKGALMGTMALGVGVSIRPVGLFFAKGCRKLGSGCLDPENASSCR